MADPLPQTVSFTPDGRPAAIELLRSLSRHRLLFAGVGMLVAGLAAGVVELLPTRYTAVASVVVTPLSPDPMQAAGREETTLRDDEVSTQAALMTSRDLAVQVAAQYDVDSAAGVATRLRSGLCGLTPWLGMRGVCRSGLPETLEGRTASFLSRLRALPEGRTRLIDLSYTDADPEVAAAALNGLVELYQKQQIAQRATDLSRTSTWISDRAEALRQTWLEAETKAGQFRARSGLTPSGARDATAPLVSQQVASAATSLSVAQAELAAARARAAALRAAGTSPDRVAFVSMRDEPLLLPIGTQLSQLRTQLAELRDQFSDKYPGLAPLRTQIASLERQMTAEITRSLRAVETEVQVKQAQVDNLQQTLRGLRGEAGEMNAQQVQLSTLEDQARSARTVFETFLARARQLDDRAGLLQSQVQFATHAAVPELPSFPNRPRLWLGAGLLGVAVAFGVVLLRDLLSRGFSNISRVGDQLALPFLCAIPGVDGRRARRTLPRYVHDHPFSSAAEAIRTLLTHFQLRAEGDAAVRTVVVASATGQEGKTTTSIWLACAAARSGSRVLLIDGDHRRGTVSQRLGGRGGPGFSDVAFDGLPIRDAVERDERQGFDFVGAGAPVSRSFNRADVDRLQATLAQLEGEYDLVVIDTPPLLSMTDALLYARLASGVVFLCRWSRTSRAAVLGCLARLRSAHANVLGIALSMVDESRLAQFSDELTRTDVRVMKRYYIG